MPKPRRSEYTCTPSVLIWTFCFAFPRYFDLSVKSVRNAQTKTLGVHSYAVGLDLNILLCFSLLFWFVGKICIECPNQDTRSTLVRRGLAKLQIFLVIFSTVKTKIIFWLLYFLFPRVPFFLNHSFSGFSQTNNTQKEGGFKIEHKI